MGRPLLSRARGGGVELTAHGQALAARARDMLALNDEAFRALVATEANVIVRLGTSTARYAPYLYLSRTLARIAAEQPEMTVEVVEAYSCQIAPRIADNSFDLIICKVEPRTAPVAAGQEEVWRGPLRWIAASNGTASTDAGPHL